MPRRNSSIKATGLLFTLAPVLAWSTLACAELPPDVYRERQARAPEALVIVVQGVHLRNTREAWGQRTHVMVMARVKQVERSRSKLKPGQLIYIRYTHDRYSKPVVGPGQVPILRRGQTCPAFLRFVGNQIRKVRGGQIVVARSIYAPAAGGYSFETIDAGE